ncbi:MAG: DUF5036 family protein [Marinifilaceae bacterium]
MRKVFCIVSVLFLFISFSCNNEKEDVSEFPEEAIILNLYNKDNGHTTIDNGKFAIDNNNFISGDSRMANFGKHDNVFVNIEPTLKSINNEMAVQPGHIYHLYGYNILQNEVIRKGEKYYQLRVEAYLYNNEKEIIGANVKYIQKEIKQDIKWK